MISLLVFLSLYQPGPEADTVRQKPFRDTDIPVSANSLAAAMCLCLTAVMLLSLYMSVTYRLCAMEKLNAR